MDTDQALSRIATANRTCRWSVGELGEGRRHSLFTSPPARSIWIGLGDAGNNELKIVSYSEQLVNIYVRKEGGGGG